MLRVIDCTFRLWCAQSSIAVSAPLVHKPHASPREAVVRLVAFFLRSAVKQAEAIAVQSFASVALAVVVANARRVV